MLGQGFEDVIRFIYYHSLHVSDNIVFSSSSSTSMEVNKNYKMQWLWEFHPFIRSSFIRSSISCTTLIQSWVKVLWTMEARMRMESQDWHTE